MFFEFEVYKDKIKPLTPMSGFSGNVNYYECRFSFSDDWAGFAPLAVFVGKETYSVPVIDGICKIPSVVLEDVGEIFIGVCASNGDEENLVRRSTGYIAFDVLKGAFKDGADYIETTVPDMWEIYEKEVLSYCERAENAADYIESIKPVTEEGEQEISGLKTFKAGIITNNISPEAEELLAVNAECIEIAGGEYAKVYSPEGRIFIGTDESEIIVSDTVDIRGAEVFINGKEIKDHLEKEDLQFDGNSITVEEVITNGVTIDGKTIEAEGGKLIYGNETIPFEKDVMHKSGDEEIEGVKSFKGVTKVKVISGMPESEDDDTQNILIDATNPTGSGGGFVNIEADTEINLKALEIYLTSETGYVSVNGSEVATAENLPRITEKTKLNKVTAEAFEIRDDGGKYGDIDGTEVFDYEDEEGNPHYASAIKIKTDKLFHNDKEVATLDDIADETNLVHKSGDEEIEGVKSFKGVTKVKVISGMPESEDDDTQNILIDATNPTGSGGGFVNIEADTEINLKALEIYLTSETGYVSVNGSEVATAENLPRITEETKLNKVTVEAFEIRDDGGRYGDIDGTEVFDYEDEEGNPHYASAIKIKTDKLFHNDKEVATKDDISSALGNIETALDTAIALCDSLIGGAV